MGLINPARKYCGKKTKLKIWLEARESLMVLSRSRPKAPPMKHESSATGISSKSAVAVSGTRRIAAKMTIGSTCMIATIVSPRIFPTTIE